MQSVEVLVALDPDDLQTYPDVLDAPCVQHWVAAERYGYARLSEYWNALAKEAAGDWLLLWNDDARMITPGWDQVIARQPLAMLHPRTDDPDQSGNYFPCWPAAWTRYLGYTSPIPGPHVDTYLQILGQHLGRSRRIPVEITHYRPDYDHPEHEDQTYREGRLALGSHGMVPGWDSATVHQLAEKDAHRLIEANLV